MGKILILIDGVLRYNIISRWRTLLPKSLMINLTYKCNSRCIMCNIWKIKQKKELSLTNWQKVMKDKIFSDIRNLTISGGEPFLYEDLFLATKIFIDSMPKLRRLIVNTNGFLPNKIEETITEIVKYCRLKNVKLVVNISVDGVANVHNSLRRTEGGFDLAFETIKKMKKLSKNYGFEIGVSSIILRQNVTKYEEMKKWLRDNNIKVGFQIVGFHANFLKNIETEKELGINKTIRKEFLKVLTDVKDGKHGWDPTKYYWEDMIAMYKKISFRTTPCSFLKDDFVIDGLGDVYYCLSVRPIGNFIKEPRSVGEIYFDPKNIGYRKHLPGTACINCNSGCNVAQSIAFDAKRLMWYKLTGKLWPGKILDVF